MRSFASKVNRKVQRAAFRSALAAHAEEGTLALIDGAAWTNPSTREAVALLAAWGKELPLVLVITDGEDVVEKSFRNLAGVVVTTPEELEVTAVVWARSLLVSEAALPVVEARAGKAKEVAA
jgi:large subunit ribosomal protein L4